MKFRFAISYLACLIFLSSPAYADGTSVQVDAICNQTMSLLKAGKVGEAYDASLGKSPLVSPTERSSLVGQMETAMKIFGSASAYELVKEHRIGTLAVRRIYFLQHEKMVSRWEIDLVKTTGGWTVSYYGYDIKSQDWDADD